MGLHRAAQPYGLVVDGGHGGPGGVPLLRAVRNRGRERAEFGALHRGALRVQRVSQPAGDRAVLGYGDGVGTGRRDGGSRADGGHSAPQGTEQRRPGLGLRGERSGDRRGGETGIGQSEPEGVDVPDEAWVHQRDAPARGDCGEQLRGLAGVGCGSHVKTE